MSLNPALKTCQERLIRPSRADDLPAFRFRITLSKVMICLLPLRPSMGARINDVNLESLIREGSGNDDFRFPKSKKPLMDFLR